MPLPHFVKLLDQLDGNPLIQLEGSGEAFLAKDLDLYIAECSKRNMKTFVKTNGSFNTTLMDKCLKAGLTYIRFSVIGHDRLSYKKNMSVDNFDLIMDNITYCIDQIRKKHYNCEISIYHILLSSDDEELQKYKTIAKKLNCKSYVWKMHNWSGNIDSKNRKIVNKRRTCGRPFANEITIRAGGEPGRYGAVTPCAQTLGPPNETKSVLGYSDKESLHDIWNGALYNELREKHLKEDFDNIDYCKKCDFLYDDPDVLVWTNDEATDVGDIQGTSLNLLRHLK